jgi:cysteinyl-tRNA synthetase
MDYSWDGSEENRFQADDIAEVKNSPGGPKTVLAYLSIGEAEDYRWYWDENWDADGDGEPDPGAPSWLGSSNPDWPGNYKVQYWDQDWQAIVREYLDTIIAIGYDGVYLDVVDAYEYWGPDGESGLNRPTAEMEMVDLVKSIAAHARVELGVTGFIVVPQNAEELGTHSDYLSAVSGIGREDVFYFDDEPVDDEEVELTAEDLDRYRNAGRPVLVIDYCREPAHVDDFYSRALERGFVPYATVRDLDSLTINPGHEPD